MSSRKRRECGSMSLTMLASVGGGVLFALSFANFVRYISVENALEQAMQRIARCIDPTDAECTQLSAPPQAGSFDWYLSTDAQSETSWADRYLYTARLTREDWQLSFPAYEIHKVPLPPITWNRWQLPLYRYQPQLNSYERRIAQIAAIFEPAATGFFTPLAEPNFPEFDPGYERDRRDQDPWQWTPRALDVPGDVRRRAGSGRYVSREATLPLQPAWNSPTLRLSDESRERRNGVDDVAEFTTGWYEVPLLDAGGVPPVCRTSSGADCDISGATGGARNDWFDRAHIAVKAFAVTRRLSGNPEIKWAGSGSIAGSPDGWGLQIERVSRNRWQAAAALADAEGRPRSSININRDDFECLGGREWSEVERSDGWKNFHLVLRGALKRRPGDNAVDEDPSVDPACPGGDRNHWNLSVERGGAYRIRGFLKARGGTLEAQVMLRSYFDSYARSSVPTEPFACNTAVTLTTTAATAPSCEEACRSLLPDLSKYAAAPASCRITLQSEPICASAENAASDGSLFPVTALNCGPEISVAQCSDGAPDAASLCAGTLSSNPKRIACITTISTSGTIDVPAQTFACPFASTSQQAAGCDDGRTEVNFDSQSNYGDPNACPSAQRVRDSLATLPPILSGGTPVSPLAPSMQWGPNTEFAPPKWVRSLDPAAEGLDLADPAVVRPAEIVLPTAGPVYTRTSADWSPPLSKFGLTPAEIAHLSASNTFSVSRRNAAPHDVRTVYPFTHRPELEIPEFLPLSENIAACSGVPASLDERLRYYASREIPEAADAGVVVDTAAEYVDSAPVKVTGGCGTAEPTAVPPCTRVTHLERETVHCGAPRYLGRFSESEFPQGPESCRTGGACYSVAVIDTAPEAPLELAVNLELARTHGYTEVERALPGAQRNCTDAGCTELEIDTENSEQTSITARYHMPLSFPLDVVLGRPTLTVEKSKRDVRELAIAGRTRP